MQTILHKVLQGGRPSRQETARLVNGMFTGLLTDTQIGGVLTVMASRGITAVEIAGAVDAIRKHYCRQVMEGPVVDTCGTGGDGSGSFNISTASAFVVAACGVPVAKHGNRSISSKCGSADVLEALGAAVDLTAEQSKACLLETGLGFYFAPSVHKVIGRVGPHRRELGIPTLFNCLGPLLSPVRLTGQVIGVGREEWLQPMAEAARLLGMDNVTFVRGATGEDELTLSGTSRMVSVRHGSVQEEHIHPDQVGLAVADRDHLSGGRASENAATLQAIFHGEQGPRRDVVLLNSAATLRASGRVTSIADGIHLAEEAIDTGRVAELVQAFCSCTQRQRQGGKS